MFDDKVMFSIHLDSDRSETISPTIAAPGCK